jgi:hypothetical protein
MKKFDIDEDITVAEPKPAIRDDFVQRVMLRVDQPRQVSSPKRRGNWLQPKWSLALIPAIVIIGFGWYQFYGPNSTHAVNDTLNQSAALDQQLNPTTAQAGFSDSQFDQLSADLIQN